MDEVKVSWQLIGVIGAFCGVIAGMVGWYANQMKQSTDKLVDTVNSHTTIIAVETKRNDDQDKRLDDHEGEIDSIKEKIWQVTYRRA